MALTKHLYDKDENVRHRDISCYPEVAKELQEKYRSIQLNQSVVDSEVNNHRLITSQGPGTALEFALKILLRSTDQKKSDEIRQKLLI